MQIYVRFFEFSYFICFYSCVYHIFFVLLPPKLKKMNMAKRLFLFWMACAATIGCGAQVTIDARDLKLYEEMAGFPFYILRMEASASTAAIRIELNVTTEDYTGSYAIGEENSALVLPAGASTSNATQAQSGTILVSRPNGDVLVTGSVKCANGVTYTLNLRLDPVPTRSETLTLNDLMLEDRILSEETFQIYGFNDDHTLYLQLTVFATMLEGIYGSRDIYQDLSQVRLSYGSSRVYYDVLTANLEVRKSGSNRVAVTGSIICQNDEDVTDIVEYTLYLSCLRDKKDDPMVGDATENDFEAFFEDYTLDTSEQALNGDIFVYARNADGACVALDMYIADGETEITAGVYPVIQGTDLSNPYMTCHASEGIIAGFTTPSYAGYLNDANELKSPVWYIMAGTVVVDAEGRMEVQAINSAERTVHCILRGKPQALEPVTFDPSQRSAAKVLRDGHIFIFSGDKTYTITGQEITNL